jgi:response regulator RpfG family c-di-GMP phosphodiesterase
LSAPTTAESYIVKRTEFLVVAKDDEVRALAQDVAEFYHFNAQYVGDIETLAAAGEEIKTTPVVILVSLLNFTSHKDKIKLVQQLHQLYARSQIVVVATGTENGEERLQLQQAGVQRWILLQEMKSSGKFYYLCSLLVHGTYLPVPVTDLFPGTVVDFNAYHKLQINQKYLPVIFAGFTFSDKKFRRLENVKQVYVRREDLGKYRKYIETYNDNRGNALKKRCRAMMMNLMAASTELMLQLTLDFEIDRGENLRAKLDQFLQIAFELGDYLKECPDVWNVISQSLEFKFCLHERSPYILAYALHIAQKIELPALQDVIMAALLADLGILELSPTCFRQLQMRGGLQLPPQDLERYHQHPMASLNRAMFKEIEMSTELKSILVCTHERADEKGFPNQVPKDNLPFEAQLIQFCERLDRRVRASGEDGILTHDFIRKQVWEEEKVSLACFNEDFLDKIEKAIVTPVA